MALQHSDKKVLYLYGEGEGFEDYYFFSVANANLASPRCKGGLVGLQTLISKILVANED